MSRSFWLALLLCTSGCTSFHDSVLSHAETDDGSAEAEVEPDAALLELDAESAPQDASHVLVDAMAPEDAGPVVSLDAGQALDAATVDAAEKTCCQLLEERYWEMGGKLPFPPCNEPLVCPKLPVLP